MIWLARAYLSVWEAAQRELRDRYAWHKAVWNCFPGQPEAGRDFLTRLDELDGRFRLYLLARREPRRPDWCPAGSWSVKPVAPSFLEHERYRFDLLANPTRKVASLTSEGERRKNGRREALADPESRLAWLRAKAGAHGFALEAEPNVGPSQNHVFYRQGKPGLHVGVRFSGTLRVVERERFNAAFLGGIGSAKAFGFGMLLLQPLPSLRTF